MDYEKEYKSLVAKVKKAHQFAQTDSTKSVLEDILPQLRESEDERTRKFLLDYAIEMIAGLESDISLSTYNGIKGHDPDAEEELSKWQKSRIYLEKQKEQKSAEVNEYEIIKKHITEDLLSSEVNKRLTECGWYVTDEKPAEWSEEDELMRTVIIQTLERFGGRGTTGMQIDWLKSLRPQPHWKPSEEQIGALNYAYCELFKREDVGHNILGPLQKLLDYLKKLM